jgi:hypothetical protein
VLLLCNKTFLNPSRTKNRFSAKPNKQDNSFDFKDKTKIDCLICHAKDGNYKKGIAGEPDRKLIEQGKMSLTKAYGAITTGRRPLPKVQRALDYHTAASTSSSPPHFMAV